MALDVVVVLVLVLVPVWFVTYVAIYVSVHHLGRPGSIGTSTGTRCPTSYGCSEYSKVSFCMPIFSWHIPNHVLAKCDWDHNLETAPTASSFSILAFKRQDPLVLPAFIPPLSQDKIFLPSCRNKIVALFHLSLFYLCINFTYSWDSKVEASKATKTTKSIYYLHHIVSLRK